MERLAEALLQTVSYQKGKLLAKSLTEEADIAFTLVGEFIEEVEEFRVAIGKRSATDLRHALKIDRRCQPNSTKDQREDAAAILHLLTSKFVQFRDWRDLVIREEHGRVEELMKEMGRPVGDGNVMPVDAAYFPPPALYFDKNAEKLAAMFGSNTTTGLPSSKIAELSAHYGCNQLPPPPKNSPLKMLWEQITDFMVIILIVAAIAEIATGDPNAAIVLFAVVFLNVVIGFTQEYKASKALEALSTLSVPKATVIRDGIQSEINSADLVPGDLVVLDEGGSVPADLRLCEVSQLEVVEAILTGESLPIQKSIRTIRKRTRKLPLGDCKGNAFMTTVVARGRGKGIVVRIGENTEIGRISKAITSVPHVRTPIQKSLQTLGVRLVILSVALCALVVIVGVAYKRDAVDMVKVGISLAVSVIPEGLVAVVTVTMALAVSRMAVNKALVKKLPSVETLGSVSHICSDKTGTLTEGKMGVSELWTSDNSLFLHSYTTKPKSVVIAPHTRLADATAAAVHLEESRKAAATPCASSADKAPSALVLSCMIASLCNNSTFDRGMERLGEFAFDSDRKLMSVLCAASGPARISAGSQFKPTDGFVLVKGAPESVLQRCTSVWAPQDEHGKFFEDLDSFRSVPISTGFVEYLSDRNASMAGKGLRVLALAMRKMTREEAVDVAGSKKVERAENDLCFVGLIGMIDPPKQGVKESIASCKRAGIKVIMITGDHIATASAIATQLGILDPNSPADSRTMKGAELDLLSEEALTEVRPFPVVFARVSPDNKLKIIKALQNRKFYVAMTGDGVNDAPAIKKADVGVAMGIGGTEITKQAADIILEDDNFSTIVLAVREGRQVFDNIKKFIVYLLSCNGAEIFLFLGAAFGNFDMPFSTIQILWANIIADIPPAMSLGVEPAEVNIMDRPPRLASEGVLTYTTATVIIVQALIQSMSTLVVYILAVNNRFHGIDTLRRQRSLAFALLTTMQLLQGFLSRSVELSVFTTGIWANKWMVWSVLGSLGTMLMGIYVPGLSDWLELEGPSDEWYIIAICVVIQVCLVELLKLGVRWNNRRLAALREQS
ncbi:hypothetical protein DFJ73DRAFT_624448 [Zopfochytrium polystomum]|nr:hypothetical protein DFJ73DRAFT_624448 [Zopfochytrium polystomum]